MENNKKILIIEDNPMERRLLRMILNQLDYLLLEANDGKEGLAMAIKEQPDLIISNVKLPELNGLQLVRQLRNIPEFVDTPMIAFTAFAMEEDKTKALEAGYDKYISKPVHINMLTQEVLNSLTV